MNPPIAAQKPHTLEKHGHQRTDNYYWMRDKEDPEVIDYLNKENDYVEEVMASHKEVREQLFEEMKGRIKEEDQSVPYHLRGFWYYTRHEEGKDYPIYCRKKGSLEGKEQILLNVNELAEGQPYCQVGSLAVANNEKWLAYSLDLVGRRIYTIHFKNIESGETLEMNIAHTVGNMMWSNDGTVLFYTKQDEETLLPYQVWKHHFDKEAADELVYEEKDNTFYISISKTKSKEYLLIASHSTVSTEYRFLSADAPHGEWKVFHPRERDLEYSIDHFQGSFYIITNWQAKNFRLMRSGLQDTSKENWEEVIAHREDVLLEGLEIFKDFWVLEERKEGLLQIRVKRWDSHEEHYLQFGESVYLAYVSTNPEFDTSVLRFGYQSMTTPSTVYDYDMLNRTKELLKQQEVVGGHDPNDYVSERIWAKAADGVEVPVSLVYKKGFEKNGAHPCYLTGYGSYGLTYDPHFSTVRLSLLDRGFCFAIAHIRGGEYLGRNWYDTGKLLQKKNTFTDFIACAEALIAQGFTTSERLVINGGSAGGLLMGVVLNERSELFKVAIAQVPFVDVVTTMLDTSIPLTTGEFDEWGNPEEKEYYDYMLSYSPYDQVKKQTYPHLLITSGLHDSQVQYWEPTKWTAKLRQYNTKDNLLLLHTNMEAGHGGASGRFKALEEIALEFAFVFKCLGIDFE